MFVLLKSHYRVFFLNATTCRKKKQKQKNSINKTNRHQACLSLLLDRKCLSYSKVTENDPTTID